MAAATDYLEQAVLKHIVGESAYTMPTTLYLALHDEDPTEAGNVGEITGGSYARQAVSWDAVSGGATDNDAVIEFEDMPAGTVSHWTLWDDDAAGNPLVHAAWTTPKTYSAGDVARIPVGDLDLTFS